MKNPYTIQLQLTDRCNLNCIYCYERNKGNNRESSLSALKRRIKSAFEYAVSNNYDFLNIYLHGGEVCLSFNILQEICEWTWANIWTIDYHFSAVTNGTLVHGQIKRWFIENSHRFSLGLSFDGSRDSHNANRSNSFESIDLDVWKKYWPNDPIKLTISMHSVKNISESIIKLLIEGWNISANLAYGQDWSNPSLIKIYSNELEKLSDFFIENPNVMPIGKILNKRILRLATYKDKEYFIPNIDCGVGTNMHYIDILGQTYPCHMFSDSNFNEIITEEFNGQNVCIDKECMDCGVFHICPTCYGFIFLKYGKIKKAPIDLCKPFYEESRHFALMLRKMLRNKNAYIMTKNIKEDYIPLYQKSISHILNSI